MSHLECVRLAVAAHASGCDRADYINRHLRLRSALVWRVYAHDGKRISLAEDTAKGYAMFQEKRDNCEKIVLKPQLVH